ncbi:hypothetical protein Golob_018856 [Gossypium lobatum]|uniref:RNase H type-1 domain-containing protein n=1 Tax=Gossypium lobatum TaxID=34289 RepID=A0A7J8L5I1_9ROSI|nr:hypothetical protein [Gossypium lobatum]
MSNESQCSSCGNVYESEIHAVCDCFFLKFVWRSVVPTHAWVSFFAMPMNDWMLWNLENVGDCGSRVVDWCHFFPIICCLLWKNQNTFVFSNCHSSSQEIIDKGVSWARNYARISYPVFQYSPMVTVAHWSEPFKGKEAIFKIEARAILEGLRQLEVESDNDLLIETIVKGGATDSQIMELRGIHQMVCRGWKVCFRHVPKTHNIVADHMAKVLATRFTKIQVFEVPPISARDLVQADYFRFTRANEPIH